MTYFKVSILLYVCFIGVGFFIWNNSGIVPTMIFYGASTSSVITMGVFLLGLIAIVQAFAFVLYQLIKKKRWLKR